MRLTLHFFRFYELVLANRSAYISAGSGDAGATHEVKRKMDSFALADGLKVILPLMMKSVNEAVVKV